ncbi:MAG: response regulator [Pseudomonadales bacterium]|nr:response regulator [Pseudomonadales bacterium]
MIKVIIADDHAISRQGIRSMLESFDDIELVGEAKNGEEAVKLAHSARPDVVLMDVRMQGIGGLEAARRIIKQNPAVRIIGLSGYADSSYPRLFLAAGAAGYILKDTPADELVQAVRKSHAGEIYVSAAVAERMEGSQNHTQNPFDELSERERQVLLLRGEDHSMEQIAHVLSVSLRSAHNYRHRGFEKLGIKSDVELVKLALRFDMLAPEKDDGNSKP